MHLIKRDLKNGIKYFDSGSGLRDQINREVGSLGSHGYDRFRLVWLNFERCLSNISNNNE